MGKQLIVRGSDGLVSIHEPGTNYNDPVGNAASIYFSSLLDYLFIRLLTSGQLYLPPRTGYMSGGTAFHVLAQHNFGYQPMLMGYVGTPYYSGNAAGTMLVDLDGADGYRTVALAADATKVYMYEQWFCTQGSTFPERLIGFDVQVFGNGSL